MASASYERMSTYLSGVLSTSIVLLAQVRWHTLIAAEAMYPNYMSFNPSHSSEPRNEDPVADRHLVLSQDVHRSSVALCGTFLNDNHGATNFCRWAAGASQYSRQSPMRPSRHLQSRFCASSTVHLFFSRQQWRMAPTAIARSSRPCPFPWMLTKCHGCQPPLDIHNL